MSFQEVVAPDESARFEGYAAELGAIQRARAAKTPPLARALHVKTHLAAVGTLAVTALPAVRVGAFSELRTYPVYVRFSNGSSAHRSDKLPDVRGFALKLVGVPGEKIIPGLEQAVTQDFLFIDQASIPFRDPEEFVTFVRAAKSGPAKLLPNLFRGFGFKRTFSLLGRLAKTPKVPSFALHTFHTAAPLSFGGRAVKLALFPLQSGPASSSKGAVALREDLAARLAEGPLAWSLRAQFFVDEQTTPIEDTSVTWTGEFVELGVLTLPAQNADSERGKRIQDLVEQLSFDPWHAVAAHRPLGAIMRARAVAYRASVITRNAAPEPNDVLAL